MLFHALKIERKSQESNVDKESLFYFTVKEILSVGYIGDIRDFDSRIYGRYLRFCQ